MDYQIKMNPDDFQVVEIPEKIEAVPQGKYTILKLRLRNWETNHFIIEFSRYLGISRKRITYAGTKDKRALTTQYFCINAQRIPERINMKDVEEIDRFTTSRIMDLGDLLGNTFNIRVESDQDSLKIAGENLKRFTAGKGFWNYFGIQRFGQMRRNTHIIGENLIRFGVESAVKSYLYTPEVDNEEYRKNIGESWDFKKGLKEFPDHLQFERALMSEIISGKSYAEVFDSLPRSLRIMFVHAYQSHIYNAILDKRKAFGLEPFDVLLGDYVSPVDYLGNIKEDNPITVTEFNMSKIKSMVVEGKVVPLAPLVGLETPVQVGMPGELVENVLEKLKNKAGGFQNR
jgi:tRNA pseudouridine synthase, TruD family